MTSTITDRFNTAPEEGVKAPCRMATTASVTLSGLQTIDGVVGVANDRVLVKNQTVASENGIYLMSATDWTRAPDWNDNTDALPGVMVTTAEGSQAYTVWVAVFTAPLTIGTTTVSFADTLVSDGSAETAVAVNAVADLAALSPYIGQVLATKWHTNSAAAGAGLYIVEAGDTSNGLNRILCSNGTTAVLQQTNGAFDLRQVGAIPGAESTSVIENSINTIGGILSGGGQSYVTSSQADLTSGVKLRDIDIQCPSLGASSFALKWTGTEGAAQVLASTLPASSGSVTVPDGSLFSQDQWVFLESTDIYANGPAPYGELVKLRTVVGNVLTFYWRTLLEYNTAAAATATPITMLRDIQLSGVSINGQALDASNGAVSFEMCEGVQLFAPDTENFDFAHIQFIRSAFSVLHGGSGKGTGTIDGLNYGLQVANGCVGISAFGYQGHDMRHVITIGGSSGVNRFIMADGFIGTELHDAGYDSHPSCQEHTFTNGQFSFSALAPTSADGSISQGAEPTITNIHIDGCRRHGVMWQPSINAPVPIMGSINGVKTKRGVGAITGGAVVVTSNNVGEQDIGSANVSDVQHSGGYTYGAFVQAVNAVNVNNVTIEGVKSGDGGATSKGLYALANGGDINNIEIRGGTHETDSAATGECIYLQGAGSSSVNNWKVIDAHMKKNGSGTIGLRLARAFDGHETGATIEGVATKYSVDAVSSGYSLDYRQSSIVTFTAAVSTVLPDHKNLIVDRGTAHTMTLPDATLNEGRELSIKTIRAFVVDSASTNVVPANDSVAGTSILPATDGAWVLLRSDGANWIVMQNG